MQVVYLIYIQPLFILQYHNHVILRARIGIVLGALNIAGVVQVISSTPKPQQYSILRASRQSWVQLAKRCQEVLPLDFLCTAWENKIKFIIKLKNHTEKEHQEKRSVEGMVLALHVVKLWVQFSATYTQDITVCPEKQIKGLKCMLCMQKFRILFLATKRLQSTMRNDPHKIESGKVYPLLSVPPEVSTKYRKQK